MVTAQPMARDASTSSSPCLRARDNPFRVERVHTFRYRPLGVTWEAIMEKCAAARMRGAIVGPQGSGKTTLLEDLEQRLVAAGHSTRWLQLRPDTRRQARALVLETLRQSAQHEILLVDGAEQIGPVTWRKFASRARTRAGLIISAHAPGRLPTIVECATNLAMLEQIVGELAPEWFGPLSPRLAELYDRHAGNLRLCLREIYDWLATGRVVRPVRETRLGN
jgi:hypothetical protein